MPSTAPPGAVATADGVKLTLPLTSLYRMAAKGLVLDAAAAAITPVLTTGDELPAKLRLAAAKGIAMRFLEEDLPWPLSTERLTSELTKLGLAPAVAASVASLLAAERIVRSATEMPAAEQAAALLNGRLAGQGYFNPERD